MTSDHFVLFTGLSAIHASCAPGSCYCLNAHDATSGKAGSNNESVSRDFVTGVGSSQGQSVKWPAST